MVPCTSSTYSGFMATPQNYEPLQILLVEDNQTFATAVKDFLSLVNGFKKYAQLEH